MRAAPALAVIAALTSGTVSAAETPTPPQPQAPAFDCAKAYLAIDHVICSSPDLLKANDELSAVWRALRERLGETERQAALELQRQWIKTYPQSCGLPAKGAPPPDKMAAAVPCVAKEIRGRAAKLRMQLAELPPPAGAKSPPPSASSVGESRWQGPANPVAADGKAARLSILDRQGKTFQATFLVRDSAGTSWTFHTVAEGGSAAASFPEDFLTPRKAGGYSYEVLVDLQPTLKGSFQLP
jgi:uncharacterized protein YecT (DUF1311 family)